MISIYLCDDNPVILQSYEKLIKQVANKKNVDVYVKAYSSGESLLADVKKYINDVDIIYLDIVMKGINGMRTARELRSLGYQNKLYFLTSKEEYVFESFGVNPDGYMVKGGGVAQKISSQIEECFMSDVKKYKHCLIGTSGNEIRRIPFDDIFYLEIQGRVIIVNYIKGKFDFYSSMKSIEKQVGNGFVRISRAFLVNMKYIDEVGKKEIVLVNGEKLRVGLKYEEEMKNKMSDFLIEDFRHCLIISND